MFSYLFIFATIASCSAFTNLIGGSRLVKGATSLYMGNMVENFRFVKHFNRFTFKTLYKCVAAAGLEEALSGAGPLTGKVCCDIAYNFLKHHFLSPTYSVCANGCRFC